MEQTTTVTAQTVLTAAYTAGDGVLTVASTAGNFPASGVFSISIFDNATLALKVQLRVTAINSATEFAVTAEGVDADADIGDYAFGVLSQAALEAFLAEANGVGTFANIPATGRAGMSYRCTDAPYHAIHDGTSWRYFYGPGIEVFPPALLSGWSWDNQGSSTVTTSRGMFQFFFNKASGLASRMYHRAFTPSKKVSVLCEFWFAAIKPLTGNSGDTGLGIALRDSGGKQIPLYRTTGLGPSGIALQKWSSNTSYSGDYETLTDSGEGFYELAARHVLWFEFEDDSTNIIARWSMDGTIWNEIRTVSRTDFMGSGPASWGPWAYVSSGDLLMNIISWKES